MYKIYYIYKNTWGQIDPNKQTHKHNIQFHLYNPNDFLFYNLNI